ncbi:hypothetical protein Hanom_Chr16g01519791 [Helianthus anomalus]
MICHNLIYFASDFAGSCDVFLSQIVAFFVICDVLVLETLDFGQT